MRTEPAKDPSPYIPALGVDWLTRFYDPVLRLTLREEKFKRLLIAQARIGPGQQVLDLGCGTATLTIMVKEHCPGAHVVGLDGDPKVLAIARQKVAAAGVDVELHEGMAFAPPFTPASFDRVVSSLVFHHLTTDNKRRTLVAIRTLLRPGGELHVADWGRPHNVLMRVAALGIRLLDGHETTADNLNGRLVALMEEAGFLEARETHQEMTMFGTLSLYRAAVGV
jgi:cyclopropane fatty-acyl-phospholipid synthase-like methyltransferase